MIWGTKIYTMRRGHDVAEAIPVLLEEGFGFFEFGLEELTPEVVRQLKKLKISGLKIGFHFPGRRIFVPEAEPGPGPNLCEDDEKNLGRMKRWLERAKKLAKIFGTETIVIHGGDPAAHASRKSAIRVLVSNIRHMLNNSQFTFLLENLPGPKLCSNPEEHVQIIKGINSERLKVCFDVGHAWQAGRATKIKPTEYLTKIYDYLGHLHFSDESDVQDHIEVGKGRIDFGPVMRLLKERGWQGPIVFEPFVKDWRAAIGSKRYLEGILKKL